ncbi:sulfatase-like hydrolase/transferase [Rubritalea tangerina]
MSGTYPSEPESWVDLLRRNGWYTVSMGKLSHEPDGYRWSYPGSYDYGRYKANSADMPFSWNEIVWDHGKWGATWYPLFAYADGTGRVRSVTPAYEAGVDADGQSLADDAYPDGQITEAAIEKLREFKDDDRRFCLALGFFKPHLPFNAPKAYFDLYAAEGLPGPSPVTAPSGALSGTVTNSGEVNSYSQQNDRAALRHAYFACVSYIDAQVGKVLDELDRLGLSENTVVVLWGDHGWCLDDYGVIGKHKVLERSLHAPLIIRSPEMTNPTAFRGQQTTGVVSTIDIYPTIAELCGLQTPEAVDGESLVPMLRNPYAPGKNIAFSLFNNLSTVRSADWRLIKVSGNYDLYDLASFPYEVEDISGENPSVVSELSTHIGQAGQRQEGIQYADWAKQNALLLEKGADSDSDTFTNHQEYLMGTDALSPLSRPGLEVSCEDLSGYGYGEQDIVISYIAYTNRNDGVVAPSGSYDLKNWQSEDLTLLDVEELGEHRYRFKFRHSALGDKAFFRLWFE